MAPGRKEDIDQKNLINIAEKKYETFLRKQMLDHSSNDKCYIQTVLGSLAAFVGDGTVHVVTHMPRLSQSFCEP